MRSSPGIWCRLSRGWRPIFFRWKPDTAASLSIPVLLFAIGLSILTGLLMGIYPALQGSHADLVEGLKEGGRGTSGSVRQQRFRKILVGAQVALSVTLLAGAALLITSFIRLSQQNIGFRSQNLWTGAVTLPTSQYPDTPSRQRFVDQTLHELRNVPVSRARQSAVIFLWLASVVIFMRGAIVMFRQSRNARSPRSRGCSRIFSRPGECRSWLAVNSMNTTPQMDRKFV